QLSLEPGVGHRIRHTPVRVVCWNTEQMAEAQSHITLNVQHKQGAKQDLALAASLLVRFREVQEQTQVTFDQMAQKQLDRERVEKVFQAAWPMPPEPAKLRLIRSVTGSEEAAQTFREALDANTLEDLAKIQANYERAVERTEEL